MGYLEVDVVANRYLVYLPDGTTRKIWALNQEAARRSFPNARSIFRITQ